MSTRRRWGAAVMLAVLATAISATPLLAETMWGGVWKDFIGPQSANTAQRFPGFGSPDLVIGNNFNAFGFYNNLAVSGTTLYSGSAYSVHQWSAVSGAEIGPLGLSSPLSDHLQDIMQGIGTTTTGNLLFGSYGYSTEQRTVAKYSPDGTWLCDYTATELQHIQGTAAGNSDVVFMASRFNLGPGWTEAILMFSEDGPFLGSFGSELGGDVGDVALMGDALYAMNYVDSGVFVYDLNGSQTPTFSHTIPFPAGVSPDAFWLDQLTASAGFLYVGDTPDAAWYKLDLSGNLLGSYDAEIVSGALFNPLGPIVVPEPTGVALLSLGAVVLLRRRPLRSAPCDVLRRAKP